MVAISKPFRGMSTPPPRNFWTKFTSQKSMILHHNLLKIFWEIILNFFSEKSLWNFQEDGFLVKKDYIINWWKPKFVSSVTLKKTWMNFLSATSSDFLCLLYDSLLTVQSHTHIVFLSCLFVGVSYYCHNTLWQ